MSNSMRGAVTFTAGGAERTLRCSTNAMVRYQDAANETIFDGLQALQDSPSDMRRIRNIFWAFLNPPDVSAEDAGDMIDEIGLQVAAGLIGDAAKAAFPEEEKDAGNGRQRKPKAA